MTGGKREEFTQVSQSDIDAAMASLTKDLDAQFDAWAAAPDDLPPGTTAFPATGQLGDAGPVGRSGDARRRGAGDVPARGDGDRHGRRGRHRARSTRSRRSGSPPTSPPITPSRTDRSGRSTTAARPTATSSTSGSRRRPRRSRSSTPRPCATRSRASRSPTPGSCSSATGPWRSTRGPASCRRSRRLDFRLDLSVAGAERPVPVGLAASPSAAPSGERPVTRILGIDLGERRIGVAVADTDGAAVPLTTLRRGRDVATDAEAILRLAAEQEAIELVVGLPLEASGIEGSQARVTRDWVEAVSPLVRLPVTLRDERLSSHLAEQTPRTDESAVGPAARRRPPSATRIAPGSTARRPRSSSRTSSTPGLAVGRPMTVRGGGRSPRHGRRPRRGRHRRRALRATAPEPVVYRRGRPAPRRAGGRPPQAPRGGGSFGLGGLAPARPVHRRPGGDRPDRVADRPPAGRRRARSSIGRPTTRARCDCRSSQDLVREDLGNGDDRCPSSSDAGQVEFTVLDGDSAASIAARLGRPGLPARRPGVRVHRDRRASWPTSSRPGPTSCART